jgi:hypothetical protein
MFWQRHLENSHSMLPRSRSVNSRGKSEIGRSHGALVNHYRFKLMRRERAMCRRQGSRSLPCVFINMGGANEKVSGLPGHKWFPLLFFFSFIGIFLFSCAGGVVREYMPKSSQEEGVKAALIGLETAWNNHSEQAVLALLDDNFVMWVWRDGRREIVFSKGTFGFRLQDILIRWRYLSMGLPDIWIHDSEATVHVAAAVDGSGTRITFRLVNRDGKWLFLEWEF